MWFDDTNIVSMHHSTVKLMWLDAYEISAIAIAIANVIVIADVIVVRIAIAIADVIVVRIAI